MAAVCANKSVWHALPALKGAIAIERDTGLYKMAVSNWQWFCGHGENFTSWTGNDFGHCFEQVVFQCPSQAILAVVCTYYSAHGQRLFKDSRLKVSWTWFLLLRCVCSVFLTLVPVCQILLSDYAVQVKPSVADCVVCGVTTFAWILHTVYVVSVRYLYTFSLRGPLSVFLAMLLVLAGQVVHTRSVIMQHIEHSAAYNPAEEYATYVSVGLLLLSNLTLIPNPSRTYQGDILSVNVNDSSETEAFLRDHARSYRTFQAHESESLTPEKGVNCVSWLSFYWVQRLMVRGSEGKIESVSDVFELPPRLDTSQLEITFQKILSNKKGVECPQSDASSNDPLVDSEVAFRGMRSEETAAPRSLLRALNKAFGWEYYSLGILKLLADGFGFAGPILLNLLVTYIETHGEPQFHGYLYACGLLFASFLGTICSTQFDYNSQVSFAS